MGKIINFSDHEDIRFKNKKLNDIKYEDPNVIDDYINYIVSNIKKDEDEFVDKILNGGSLIEDHYKIFYYKNWERLSLAKKLDEIGGILVSLIFDDEYNNEDVFVVTNFPSEIDDANGITQNAIVLNIKLFAKDEKDSVAPEIFYSAMYEFFYYNLEKLYKKYKKGNINSIDLEYLNNDKYLLDSLKIPRLCLNREYDFSYEQAVLIMCDPREICARNNALLSLKNAYKIIKLNYGVDVKFEEFINKKLNEKRLIEKRIDEVFGNFENGLKTFNEEFVRKEFKKNSLLKEYKSDEKYYIVNNFNFNFKFKISNTWSVKTIEKYDEIYSLLSYMNDDEILVNKIAEISYENDIKREIKNFKNLLTKDENKIVENITKINEFNGIKYYKIKTEKEGESFVYFIFKFAQNLLGYLKIKYTNNYQKLENEILEIISSWEVLNEDLKNFDILEGEFKKLYISKKEHKKEKIYLILSNIYNNLLKNSGFYSFKNDEYYNFFKGVVYNFLEKNNKIQNFTVKNFYNYFQNVEGELLKDNMKSYLKNSNVEIKKMVYKFLNLDNEKKVKFINITMKNLEDIL